MSFTTLSEIASLSALVMKNESLFNIRDVLNLTLVTQCNKHNKQKKIPKLHQAASKVSHYE